MVVAYGQFVAATVVSLLTSWILVTRLERVGERFGLSEALLGLVAALAADAPEITSSVSALVSGDRTIGAGVVIGSNVFNLAALLGLGALVAGFITLHRRVVIFAGSIGLWVGGWAVAATLGLVSVGVALAGAGLVLLASVVLFSVRRERLLTLRLPWSWRDWLILAVTEEEDELDEAIRPRPATGPDYLAALAALVVVVAASTVMEHAGTRLGHHYHWGDALIGALLLAGVTSLPNAVAAVHLAAKGRGAAALSTTMNSNNLNVVAGLLIPSLILGIARPSLAGNLTVWWYVGLTVVTLSFAFASRGLRRGQGAVIVASYLAYVVVLVTLPRRG